MPRDADEDDRPRRRRYEEEDDDDDDRPRPRRKRRKPAGPPVALVAALAGGAGLLLLLFVGVVGYVALRNKPAPQPAFRPAAVPLPPAAPPAPVVPPAADPAPAGQTRVTITAVRRATGFAGKPVLEIDYQVPGGFVPGRAVVLVKSREGTTEANVMGMLGMGRGGTSGTWKLEKFGFGGFSGRLEVWVESRFGLSGGVISNTFVVD